jgi:hypothetical protein
MAPCDLVSCQQILHRATRWVELDRTIVVNGKLDRTETRFLISCGETRTLLRHIEGDKAVAPVVVTGMKEPLPTTMEEGARK